MNPAQPWIWPTRPWGRSISGGKVDVGSGEFILRSSQVFIKSDAPPRDVAAGIAILEEAGGLVTTANPPDNPNGAEIPKAQLGSRLYLAIRYVCPL